MLYITSGWLLNPSEDPKEGHKSQVLSGIRPKYAFLMLITTSNDQSAKKRAPPLLAMQSPFLLYRLGLQDLL